LERSETREERADARAERSEALAERSEARAERSEGRADTGLTAAVTMNVVAACGVFVAFVALLMK
jgi:hypothetical protein